VTEHPRWHPSPPPDDVLRGPSRRSESAAEQDAAAGGREERLIRLADGGTATASVWLHRPAGRRVYAYLRYKHARRNHRFYLGDVSAPTREEALRLAWELAKKKNLLRGSCERLAQGGGQA
jgi:DNA mismatch endonuclease (patch repair protein)